MPGLFIFAILLAVVSVVAFAIFWLTRLTDDSDARSTGVAAAVVGVVLLVGAVITTLASSFNSVGTYDIGVTTNFGKVQSYVGPGAHFIAPWDKMSLVDESVQQTDDTLTVRVAGQQTAVADVKLRWQIIPSATDALYKQYKGNTQNVGTALVTPELNVAMNSVYDGYDPILPLSTGAKPGTPDNPSTAQLSDAVKAQLNASIGSQVKVDTLIVQPLKYDDTVTQRINSVLAQTAQTDKAKESVKTAQQQAAAYQAVANQIAKNPYVIAKQCMDGLADGQIQNEPGFSCYPPAAAGAASGAAGAIVIPAAGK